MNSKHLRGDINLAWANTEIAVMGAKGASQILYKNYKVSTQEKEALIEGYKEKFASPLVAASRGYIDDIIAPSQTRWKICQYLNMIENKKVTTPWKKHDNLPL